jgi:hypothetical protein
MRPTGFSAFLAMTSITAAALCSASGALAQSYRPEFNERPGQAPSLAMSLSPSAIDALNFELDEDFRALDAFSRGKRGVDRFTVSTGSNRPRPWTFYGRFGLVNFQNRFTEQRLSETDISWRRTGPSLTGRYYIGIHKQFW